MCAYVCECVCCVCVLCVCVVCVLCVCVCCACVCVCMCVVHRSSLRFTKFEVNTVSVCLCV